MINILGVRIFYQYQSRLLQSGFSALFGPKFQELVLKLSFTLANATSHSGGVTKIPDILGIIARAKTSNDAVTTSKEVALIGQYVCNSEPARFQERGIMDYASNSVNLDIELLEDVREEACQGMDAFDTIMTMEASSGVQRVTAMCSFLMQILERMAKRLEVFYYKLAQHSIYQPEIELHPARTRWDLVRRRIRDGSLFVLARVVAVEAQPTYKHSKETVGFDNILSQVKQTIQNAPPIPSQPILLTEQHLARAKVAENAPSAMESYENGSAVRRMSSFIDSNQRAMRRLSRIPATAASGLEQLMKLAGQQTMAAPGMPTPPSSRGSSRSPPGGAVSDLSAISGAEALVAAMKLNKRAAVHEDTSTVSRLDMGSGQGAMTSREMSPPSLPSVDGKTVMRTMMSNLNNRSRSMAAPASPSSSGDDRGRRRAPISAHTEGMSLSHRVRSSPSTLRSLRLREIVNDQARESRLSASN